MSLEQIKWAVNAGEVVCFGNNLLRVVHQWHGEWILWDCVNGTAEMLASDSGQLVRSSAGFYVASVNL